MTGVRSGGAYRRGNRLGTETTCPSTFSVPPICVSWNGDQTKWCRPVGIGIFQRSHKRKPATPAFFINPVNAPIPWVINGQIREGDGIENHHRGHGYQSAWRRRTWTARRAVRCSRLCYAPAIVRLRIMPRNTPHIDDHKTEQLRLTGAVVFAINFFSDAVDMFQRQRMVSARNIIKHITETATSVFYLSPAHN